VVREAMKQPVERRLAATLAADVAGYSRLMGEDEEGTHERLKSHLSELVEPKIREHRGRIVKNTGDGMLAEFFSVVDAVGCAAEVQSGMVGREPEVADTRNRSGYPSRLASPCRRAHRVGHRSLVIEWPRWEPS
jgi:class 3 adenylate cyclase